MHSLKVTPIFLIVDYGGILISTARERLTPEVTSPVDWATTVFYSCFIDIYRLSRTVSTLFALLLLPKMAERRFRPLGGVLDRKWSHRLIAWSRFCIGLLWNFSIIFYLSKVIRLFRFACKVPFENFGEGIFPREKFFSSMRTPKGTSLAQNRLFDVSLMYMAQAIWPVEVSLEKKERKKERNNENGKLTLHITYFQGSPQWTDLNQIW
jgi:hypothetical protein